MTRIQILAASLLVLSACTAAADTTDLEDSLDEATESAIVQAEDATDTTLGNESAEAVAKLQTSMDIVTGQLQEIDLGEDATVAWAEIQARVSDVVASVQADPDFDRSAIDSILDAFEAQIAASEPASEFEAAWAEFRADFEAFLDASTEPG